jgi:hypothetical protein
MDKRQNLIKNLNLVVNALKNDAVLYAWNSPGSCNCGVIAQALLDVDRRTLLVKYDEARKACGMDGIPALQGSNGTVSPTWKNLVHASCSVTGKSMVEVINTLREKGLTAEDIVHLEYMENPAILAVAGEKIQGKSSKYYSTKSNLIAYLEAWIKRQQNIVPS